MTVQRMSERERESVCVCVSAICEIKRESVSVRVRDIRRESERAQSEGQNVMVAFSLVRSGSQNSRQPTSKVGLSHSLTPDHLQ